MQVLARSSENGGPGLSGVPLVQTGAAHYFPLHAAAPAGLACVVAWTSGSRAGSLPVRDEAPGDQARGKSRWTRVALSFVTFCLTAGPFR